MLRWIRKPVSAKNGVCFFLSASYKFQALSEEYHGGLVGKAYGVVVRPSGYCPPSRPCTASLLLN
ncbi:hypothetical protein NEUTE1DRAFT_117544 [Neurospora tetrasperma FGSC 2508]|uniref:Uncharacterized protein n=1 Tax=Neurospora tetrasperma (strain FGSC 2508 / ATCC MYA-4615 / P0657) TaxID=510951 RepID=F8MNK0_NEUT8|nr:uncharacterized protein NEUTE1DRAFT_117544 [Neurospora tetrasperma FGSC 2508]EGO56968.1 hypothetical protein NEUTE1DRAFT_117544 [Neurospora tetrasperma FGSC 2508]EGZ70129.1 hypothetical protein NEUTE2DRAFT_144938 [Neurospora tetrasperma FGSC 2509]